MSPDPLVRRWHEAIIKAAEAKLKRSLQDHERQFIVSRKGLVALEIIQDTVRASAAAALEAYLGSER